jgi:membrane peptidoglycan carboxypeptidase
VINSGTGTAAQLGRPAAGKTGTTSNNTDAWFVGYTPTLSTAVWMGNVNGETSMGPVRGCLEAGYCYTVGQVYGGTWPAITWKEFMAAALKDVPVTPFNAPAPIVTPTEAAALQQAQHQTTTTLGIQPGLPGAVVPTPPGGPYEVPAPTPIAPPPPTSPPTIPPSTVPETTTTSPEETTTTLPPDTTTTNPPPFLSRR